jgi:hypothetical protein
VIDTTDNFDPTLRGQIHPATIAESLVSRLTHNSDFFGRRASDKIIVLALIAVAAVLVLPNLGNTCLWEDEAQTALLARNILSQGVPAASDGKNSVSIFPDHRDVHNGIHIWQGWFPSYLAAASMAAGGKTSWAARFPFTLSFVILIAYFWLFLNKHGDSSRHIWLTIFLTITCVPLLCTRGSVATTCSFPCSIFWLSIHI